MKGTFTVSIFACAHLAVWAAGSSWPQFRGPNSSGVAQNDRPPVYFSDGTNQLWKVEVPAGLSSPCVAGHRLFLSAFADGKLLTLCYDTKSGRELWRKEAPPAPAKPVNGISSPAVATPATDGERVFIYYPAFGLIAYDIGGQELWRKPVPTELVMNGSGTSPAIAGHTLVLNCDQDEGESFIIAVDAATGKTRWQTQRPDFVGSYSTPITWQRGETEEAIVAGSLRVIGYDLRTGQERWTARVLTSVSVAPTPVIGDGHVYVMSRGAPPNAMGTFDELVNKNDKDADGKISKAEAPRGFVEGGVFRTIDRDKDGFITEGDWKEMNTFFARGDSGLFALRAPGAGDITATHVAWKKTKGVAGISSPLFYEGRVYVVQDGGRMTCWDAKSGKVHYEQERLGADGEYYASPIAAHGHVYVASTRGMVTVLATGDSLEVKARNKLGERIMATPAIANDAIYVRTAKHLYAFAAR